MIPWLNAHALFPGFGTMSSAVCQIREPSALAEQRG
jgi:hypothetical protein